MDIPLEILDVEVARAAADLSAARVRLARGDLAEARTHNPLAAHRRASERATWLALAEPPPSVPALPGAAESAAPARLATALRPWVYALTLERVLWADTVLLAEAWRAPAVNVEGPSVAPVTESAREMLLRVLREPDARRRRIFDRALAEGSAAVHDAARVLAERRVEAARLLGAAPDAIEIPVDPPPAVPELASRLLAETAPMAERASVWSAALSASTGRAFAEGWPARLGPRWLFELFGAGPLTEGLRIALPPLPAPLGATSFARALGAFGAALGDADGPLSTAPATRKSSLAAIPFALTRHPFDLVRARRAALFASLAADPVFGTRALGLSRGRARDQARGVARALLTSLRLDAARVLCRGVLSLPNHALASRFEEVTADALGAPIPPSLAGVVPQLGPGDACAFAGALLAARDRRVLVERFDEDWFRSPHAAHAIREEDADVPPSHTAPRAALEAGFAEILRALGEL